MGKIAIDEQVKSKVEITPARTTEVLESLESAFKRVASSVKMDEDEHSFRLTGINAGFAVAEANFELKDKNDKYILSGSISGSPSMNTWICVGAGALLLILGWFVFWPLFLIGPVVSALPFILMGKGLGKVAQTVRDEFEKAVKD